MNKEKELLEYYTSEKEGLQDRLSFEKDTDIIEILSQRLSIVLRVEKFLINLLSTEDNG